MRTSAKTLANLIGAISKTHKKNGEGEESNIVQVSWENGQFIIRSSNSAIHVVAKATDVSGQNASVSVRADELCNALLGVEDDEKKALITALSDNTLSVSGNGSVSLSSLEHKQTVPVTATSDPLITVVGADLLAALDSILFAVSSDGSQKEYIHLHLIPSECEATMTAIGNNVFAIYALSLEGVDEETEERKILIHSDNLKRVQALLKIYKNAFFDVSVTNEWLTMTSSQISISININTGLKPIGIGGITNMSFGRPLCFEPLPFKKELNNVNKVKQGNILRIKSDAGTTSMSCGAYSKDSVLAVSTSDTEFAIDLPTVIKMISNLRGNVVFSTTEPNKQMGGSYLIKVAAESGNITYYTGGAKL